jgi:hypothetical protein
MSVGGHQYGNRMTAPMACNRSDLPKYTKLIDDRGTQGYGSQLSMNKPFASNDFAAKFCVCNPRKAQGGDHIVYSVFGFD